MGRFVAVVILAAWATTARAVVLTVGSVDGYPGATVPVPVTLATEGATVTAAIVDLAFPPAASIPPRTNGRPDCAVNPAIEKDGTSFAFQPSGCIPGEDCTGVRALVVSNSNVDPIPDGATLFTCPLSVAFNAVPPLPIACGNVGATDDDGRPLAARCVPGAIFLGPTPTPTATGTPTATRTGTRTPTASPSPTPCVGDCHHVGEVRIPDLITGVNIALGAASVDACAALDVNSNGAVTINELIEAVANALGGCG